MNSKIRIDGNVQGDVVGGDKAGRSINTGSTVHEDTPETEKHQRLMAIIAGVVAVLVALASSPWWIPYVFDGQNKDKTEEVQQDERNTSRLTE